MKNKDRREEAIHEFLEWLKRERSEQDWRRVFNKIILRKYPNHRQMHKSLRGGSLPYNKHLPPTVEKNVKGKKKNKEASSAKNKKRGKNTCGDEERPGTSSQMTPPQRKKFKKVAVGSCNEQLPPTVEKKVKRKKKNNEASPGKNKKRIKNPSGDEEQPGTSSQMTPPQREKSKKVAVVSLEKKAEIWTRLLFENHWPVTCGKEKGRLSRERCFKGEECIKVKDRWFTPPEFEKFAGKEKSRNWKMSIKCENITLGKLIQWGYLKPGKFKKSKMVRKSLFSKRNTTQESDEDENEVNDTEQHVGSRDEENSTSDSESDEDKVEDDDLKQQDSSSNEENSNTDSETEEDEEEDEVDDPEQQVGSSEENSSNDSD